MRELLEDALAWVCGLVLGGLTVLILLGHGLLGGTTRLEEDDDGAPYGGKEKRRPSHNRGGSDLD